jgi:hypothetical protein
LIAGQASRINPFTPPDLAEVLMSLDSRQTMARGVAPSGQRTDDFAAVKNFEQGLDTAQLLCIFTRVMCKN